VACILARLRFPGSRIPVDDSRSASALPGSGMARFTPSRLSREVRHAVFGLSRSLAQADNLASRSRTTATEMGMIATLPSFSSRLIGRCLFA